MTKSDVLIKDSEIPILQKLVQIQPQTIVSIVEYDLCQFSGREGFADWLGMLESWLEQGADVNLYYQAPDKNSLTRLNTLIQAQGSALSVRDFSRTAEYVPGGVAAIEVLQTFHFSLFENPNQLWIEQQHLPGAKRTFDCEYLPKEICRGDMRYKQFLDLTRILERTSERLI